jgi:hypothetical protein
LIELGHRNRALGQSNLNERSKSKLLVSAYLLVFLSLSLDRIRTHSHTFISLLHTYLTPHPHSLIDRVALTASFAWSSAVGTGARDCHNIANTVTSLSQHNMRKTLICMSSLFSLCPNRHDGKESVGLATDKSKIVKVNTVESELNIVDLAGKWGRMAAC